MEILSSHCYFLGSPLLEVGLDLRLEKVLEKDRRVQDVAAVQKLGIIALAVIQYQPQHCVGLLVREVLELRCL